VLLFAAVFGLALLLEPTSPPALSALIVAIVTMIIGGIALMIGRNRLRASTLRRGAPPNRCAGTRTS
jgi:hypothetical protein